MINVTKINSPTTPKDETLWKYIVSKQDNRHFTKCFPIKTELIGFGILLRLPNFRFLVRGQVNKL